MRKYFAVGRGSNLDLHHSLMMQLSLVIHKRSWTGWKIVHSPLQAESYQKASACGRAAKVPFGQTSLVRAGRDRAVDKMSFGRTGSLFLRVRYPNQRAFENYRGSMVLGV